MVAMVGIEFTSEGLLIRCSTSLILMLNPSLTITSKDLSQISQA